MTQGVVYILQCSNGEYYVGSTTNIDSTFLMINMKQNKSLIWYYNRKRELNLNVFMETIILMLLGILHF